MGRIIRKKKATTEDQSQLQLNQSISTYGKLQTRLLNNVPNLNWLPSDDSFSAGHKPKALTNITNQKLPGDEVKLQKIRGAIFDSDTDDDFRSDEHQSNAWKSKRMKIPLLPDKVNTENLKHIKNGTRRRVPRNPSTPNNDKRSQKRKRKNHHLKQSKKKSSVVDSEPKGSDNGEDVVLVESGKNYHTAKSTTQQFQEEMDSPAVVQKSSMHVEISDIAKLHRHNFPHANNSQNLKDSNDCLHVSSSSKNLLQHDSLKISRNSGFMSADLFSPPPFSMSRVQANSVIHNKSGNCDSSLNCKQFKYGDSFNSTVIQHAANFEVPDMTVRETGGPCSKSSIPLISLAIIQSTPLVNSRKSYEGLKNNTPLKMNPIYSPTSIRDSAASPKLKENIPRESTVEMDSKLSSTSCQDLVASPMLHGNLLTDASLKTDEKLSSTPVMDSKQNRVALNRETKCRPTRNNVKPKAAKRNKRQKFQKSKPPCKRVWSKCNRSMSKSNNNSILQHIMMGNPIAQKYHYDFLENSKDAYFVDTSSRDPLDLKLGSTGNEWHSKENGKKDVPPKDERSEDHLAPSDSCSDYSNNKTNCGIHGSSSLFDNPQSSNTNFYQCRDKASNCLTTSFLAKKKCLRKKSRVDYKLMISGSWYNSSSSFIQLRSDDTMSKENKEVSKRMTGEKTEQKDTSENFKLLHQQLEDGNINRRRKVKFTHPSAQTSDLFSPLSLGFKSRGHQNPDHLQSPILTGHASRTVGDMAMLTQSGFRSRSPGSHLKSPCRIRKMSEFETSNIDSRDKLGHSLGFAEALSPVGKKFLTEREKVLIECNQLEPISFDTTLSNIDISECTKLGEGTYGEVFGSQLKKTSEKIAMKIIPIGGDLRVNGELQKTFSDILPEILSSKELSGLSNGQNYATDGFIKLHTVQCVQGKYPELLLKAWDVYDEEECSENDCPRAFTDNQLFIILIYSNGGTDVEHYKFRLAAQAFSVTQQVCAALAVAENALEFEHRDLHWGNILVAPTRSKEVSVILEGISHRIQTHGVKVSIIDFSLSRLSKDGVTAYQDLSNDPGIFDGDINIDYQFEVYRMMKEITCNNWSRFCPKSNIFWLHYINDKFLKCVKYSHGKASKHKSFMHKCRFLSKNILDYDSCSHALISCPNLSL